MKKKNKNSVISCPGIGTLAEFKTPGILVIHIFIEPRAWEELASEVCVLAVSQVDGRY